MRSSYKKLGQYIREVNVRDVDKRVGLLLGVSIEKIFKPSIANTIGTDMSTYKIVKQNQFAYGPVTSRNGDKISIALLQDYDEAIVSQAYTSFEVIDTDQLLPEYLMMWFRRTEFDRYARFKSHGSAREIFGWEEMCEVELPIPPAEKQSKIVKEYNTIVTRLQLNEQLKQKLEETAQALYRQWFLDFEFPDENGMKYKSNRGEMAWNDELEKEIPTSWKSGKLSAFIKMVNGYAFKSDEFCENGDYPILKIKNITPPNVTIGDSSYYRGDLISALKKVIVESGDILISMTGSGANQMESAVGKVGRYNHKAKALLNQRVGKLKLKETEIGLEYVYRVISTQESQIILLAGSTGSANQANISPGQIEDLSIVLPSKTILRKFECLCSALNKNIVWLDSFGLILNELKNVLLSRMSKMESSEVNQMA